MNQKSTPFRKVDTELMREQFAEIEARQTALMQDGQRLLGRIRKSSKYYGQGEN